MIPFFVNSTVGVIKLTYIVICQHLVKVLNEIQICRVF